MRLLSKFNTEEDSASEASTVSLGDVAYHSIFLHYGTLIKVI